MVIAITIGQTGNFIKAGNKDKKTIKECLISQITDKTVYSLFREGKRKETIFDYTNKSFAARIDLQSHANGYYNIQIQMGKDSYAGVLIVESFAYIDSDPKKKVDPVRLAQCIRDALSSSLERGENFWEVKPLKSA